MKEQLPYTTPDEREQTIINSIMRKYHIRGNPNESHCKLNELRWSDTESNLHLERKLILAFVFRHFISEASRTHNEMDHDKRYIYQNGNGREIIRDIVDLSIRHGLVHECETGIGRDDRELRYKRFLYQLPWIAKGDEKKGWKKNTIKIRDPDYNKIILHLFTEDEWKVYRIYNKGKYLFTWNKENNKFDEFLKSFNLLGSIEKTKNKIKIEGDKRAQLILKNKSLLLYINERFRKRYIVRDNKVFDITNKHFAEHQLELKEIKIYGKIPIIEFESIARERMKNITFKNKILNKIKNNLK